MAILCHFSEKQLELLRAEIGKNIDRYRGSGFEDLANDAGWRIDVAGNIEISELANLDGASKRAEADCRNSKIVWSALSALSPNWANEERIWARLCHVECFDYSRQRWLGKTSVSDITEDVRTHMFARTQTQLRDDNAISRLWWNGFIAKQCYPHDVERGLELLLSTADVRSNLVERVWLMGRRNLAQGVFRAMERDPFVLSSEESFRLFMKSLNLLGGGIVFETMSEKDIDVFLDSCMRRASSLQSTGSQQSANS